MPFCTGQGTDDVGGCCHLGNGEICPHYRQQDGRHLCNIAQRILDADPSLLTDRVAFEVAWTEHPDYQRDVRPAWDALEQRMGYEPNSFNCATWRGPGCCWTQDDATCDSQVSGMDEAVVALRRAGGT